MLTARGEILKEQNFHEPLPWLIRLCYGWQSDWFLDRSASYLKCNINSTRTCIVRNSIWPLSMTLGHLLIMLLKQNKMLSTPLPCSVLGGFIPYFAQITLLTMHLWWCMTFSYGLHLYQIVFSGFIYLSASRITIYGIVTPILLLIFRVSRKVFIDFSSAEVMLDLPAVVIDPLGITLDINVSVLNLSGLHNLHCWF